jgi:hypothetical protein
MLLHELCQIIKKSCCARKQARRNDSTSGIRARGGVGEFAGNCRDPANSGDYGDVK